MKLRVFHEASRAWTLIELLVVIAVLAVLLTLAMLLIPVLSVARATGGITCVNQLHQTGLAFGIWQGDNHGKFPMAVSVANGGAMEAATKGNAAEIFQVISNELRTTKVLICPADKHHKAATNFATLEPKNISYFVGLDASTNCPQSILSGDDNFEIGSSRVKSGLVEISSNTRIAWFIPRHKFYGFLLFADGSVQGVSNFGLTNYFCSTDAAHMRLAIP